MPPHAGAGSFSIVIALTAAAIIMGHAGPAYAQTSGRAPIVESVQTVAVTRGARLTLENYAGEVVVAGWDRDVVRVQARHPESVRVSIRHLSSGVTVSSSTARGPRTVDYTITVPAWMPVTVTGYASSISVTATDNEISADTVRGDVLIKGGASYVSARSIEGSVTISGTRGHITASSVNDGVTIENSSGNIVADAVNGPIRLANATGDRVEAGSVNGHITYEGAVAGGGTFRFSSHNGNITVAIPATAGAALGVRTYNGAVAADLPLQRTGEPGKGRRAVYVLGTANAQFEIESFGGIVHLRRLDRGADKR